MSRGTSSDPEDDESERGDDAVPDDDSSPRKRFAGVSEKVDATRSTVLERAEAFEKRWPPLAVLRAFVSRYLEVNGVVLAGHLAFRSFTFLFPLALVVVALAGLAHRFGYDPGDTASSNLHLGAAIGESVRTAGKEAGDAPYHVAFVAVCGLVLGTLGMLSGLHYVFVQAWQVKQRKVEARLRKMWRLGLSFLLLAVVLSASGIVRDSGVIIGVVGTLALSGVFFLSFLGLGLMMPRRCEEWYWLIPGAIVGAIGMSALQIFGSVYLPDKLASLSSTYGTLSIAIVLLSYLFIVGQVVVASAIASAVWFDLRMSWRAEEEVARQPLGARERSSRSDTAAAD